LPAVAVEALGSSGCTVSAAPARSQCARSSGPLSGARAPFHRLGRVRQRPGTRRSLVLGRRRSLARQRWHAVAGASPRSRARCSRVLPPSALSPSALAARDGSAQPQASLKQLGCTAACRKQLCFPTWALPEIFLQVGIQ